MQSGHLQKLGVLSISEPGHKQVTFSVHLELVIVYHAVNTVRSLLLLRLYVKITMICLAQQFACKALAQFLLATS